MKEKEQKIAIDRKKQKRSMEKDRVKEVRYTNGEIYRERKKRHEWGEIERKNKRNIDTEIEKTKETQIENEKKRKRDKERERENWWKRKNDEEKWTRR